MRRVHDWPRGRGHEIQPRKNASAKTAARARSIQNKTNTTTTAVASPATTANADPPSPASSTSSLTTLSDDSDEEDELHNPPSQSLSNARDSMLENELASANTMPAFRAATNLPYPVINTLVPAAIGRAAAIVTKVAAAVARVKAALEAEASIMTMEEAALTAGTPQAPTSQPRFSQAAFDAAVHARLRAAAPRIYAAALTVSSTVSPLIYYANFFL